MKNLIATLAVVGLVAFGSVGCGSKSNDADEKNQGGANAQGECTPQLVQEIATLSNEYHRIAQGGQPQTADVQAFKKHCQDFRQKHQGVVCTVKMQNQKEENFDSDAEMDAAIAAADAFLQGQGGQPGLGF